jgi:WD40 repeat protein
MAHERIDTMSVLYMYPLREHVRVKRHRGECCCEIANQDRKSIVSAGVHGDVLAWDWSTGPEIEWLSRETGIPPSMALRADGKMLWIGGADPVDRNHVLPIRRWTWDWFTRATEVGNIRWGARWLANSPDGDRLAIITSDNEMMLWKAWERYNPTYLVAHYWGLDEKQCWGIAFSKDGRTLVSSGDDHNVRVWDFPSRLPRHVLAPDLGGNETLTSCVAIDPTGKYWASGDYLGDVKLWNAATGQFVATLVGHEAAVRSVALSPDGKLLASGEKDNRLIIWNVETHEPIKTLTCFEGAVRGVAFSPDGRWLAACSLDETVALFNAATLAEVARFAADDKLTAVVFTPNSKEVVCASEAGHVFVREVASGNLIHRLTTDNDQLLSVTVSPDGATIAAGGVNKTVYLWHRETGHELLRFDNLGGQVNCLAFDPQGNTLAAALHNGTIAFWEATPAGQAK